MFSHHSKKRFVRNIQIESSGHIQVQFFSVMIALCGSWVNFRYHRWDFLSYRTVSHVIATINLRTFIVTTKIGLFSLPLSDAIISWLDFKSSPFNSTLRSLSLLDLLLVVLSGSVPASTRRSTSIGWGSLLAGLFDECGDLCDDFDDFLSSSLFLRGDESSLEPDFLRSFDLDDDDFDLFLEPGLFLLNFGSSFSLFRRLRGSRSLSSLSRDPLWLLLLLLFAWLNFGILGIDFVGIDISERLMSGVGIRRCMCGLPAGAVVTCVRILTSRGSRERAEAIIIGLAGAMRTRPCPWWCRIGGIFKARKIRNSIPKRNVRWTYRNDGGWHCAGWFWSVWQVLKICEISGWKNLTTGRFTYDWSAADFLLGLCDLLPCHHQLQLDLALLQFQQFSLLRLHLVEQILLGACLSLIVSRLTFQEVRVDVDGLRDDLGGDRPIVVHHVDLNIQSVELGLWENFVPGHPKVEHLLAHLLVHLRF